LRYSTNGFLLLLSTSAELGGFSFSSPLSYSQSIKTPVSTAFLATSTVNDGSRSQPGGQGAKRCMNLKPGMSAALLILR
jgi:hypothetical protein